MRKISDVLVRIEYDEEKANDNQVNKTSEANEVPQVNETPEANEVPQVNETPEVNEMPAINNERAIEESIEPEIRRSTREKKHADHHHGFTLSKIMSHLQLWKLYQAT
jgi:rubrerythrin